MIIWFAMHHTWDFSAKLTTLSCHHYVVLSLVIINLCNCFNGLLMARFRHRKVLLAEENHGITSSKEHLCHSQYRSGCLSHWRDNITQFRWSVAVFLNVLNLSALIMGHFLFSNIEKCSKCSICWPITIDG